MLLASKKDAWFILYVVDNSDFKLDIKNFLDKIDDKSVRLTILAGCMVIYQMGYITRLYEQLVLQKNNSSILIVDDEPDVALSLKKALADNGFELVATLNDPLLALRNFKPDLYDLLILDIVMPQMDGFELYREIKEIDNRVKVCFITAFEVNYQALRVLFPTVTTTDDIGCFIRKPIEGKTLVKHVEAGLS